MPAHAYATPADVYREIALGARAFVTMPRHLDPFAGDSLDAATGTFSMLGHGFDDDAQYPDVVRLVLVGAGALPGGATSTPVYPIPLDGFRFRVSATPGGAALTYSDEGDGAWGVQTDHEPRLRRLARSCSAIIDEHLTAHSTPLLVDPITLRYPEVVIGLCARMVGRRYLPTMAGENPGVRAAIDRLLAQEALDGDGNPPGQQGSLLGDWKRGKPIAPTPTDQTVTSDNAPRAGTVGGFDAAWVTGSM